MHFPSIYIGFFRPSYIENTLKNEVPAWGEGEFSCCLAFGLWSLAFLGIAGAQRCYLGDTCSFVLYLLTGGLCCIGQLVDLCYIYGNVNTLNSTIKYRCREKYRKKNMKIVPGQPVLAPIYSNYAQPGTIPPPGYPQPAYPPQQAYPSQPTYAGQPSYPPPPPNLPPPPNNPQSGYPIPAEPANPI